GRAGRRPFVVALLAGVAHAPEGRLDRAPNLVVRHGVPPSRIATDASERTIRLAITLVILSPWPKSPHAPTLPAVDGRRPGRCGRYTASSRPAARGTHRRAARGRPAAGAGGSRGGSPV